jgi:hypothetical protein
MNTEHYMTWRRKYARSESLALRCLLRTHGRMPTFQPTVITIADWHHHCRGGSTAKKVA